MKSGRRAWEVDVNEANTIKTRKHGERHQGERFVTDDNKERYIGICHARAANCSGLVLFDTSRPAWTCGSAACRQAWASREKGELIRSCPAHPPLLRPSVVIRSRLCSKWPLGR